MNDEAEEVRGTIRAATATKDRLGRALDAQAVLLAEWDRTPAPRPEELVARIEAANSECRDAIAEAYEWVDVP